MFLNFRDASVWAYLTDNAAWRDNTDVRFDGRRVILMTGQVAISERFLAEGFCCDRQVIRRILEALEKDQMITRDKTHGITIITICNYREYQSSLENEKPTATAEKTQVEPRSNPNIEEYNNSKNTTADASPAPWVIVGYRVMDMMQVRDDPNWFGNASPAKTWLEWGADPKIDIYPTVEAILRRDKARGRGPPKTLNFFDSPISDAIANRKRPRPEAQNGNSPSAPKSAKPTRDSDRRAILETLGFGPGINGLELDADAQGPILDGQYRRSN